MEGAGDVLGMVILLGLMLWGYGTWAFSRRFGRNEVLFNSV